MNVMLLEVNPSMSFLTVCVQL